MPDWFGLASSVDFVADAATPVGSVLPEPLVVPMADPGESAWFRPASSVGLALSGPSRVAAVRQAWSVGLTVAPDDSVCPRPASSVDRASARLAPDGLGFPAGWVVDAVDWARASPEQALPVFQVRLVCRALVCSVMDGGRQADSQDDYFPDGWASARGDLEAGSVAGDIPNCRGSRDDWPTQSAAGGTNGTVDDKDSPNRSSSRGYSKRAEFPNSIPNRPIPRDAYLRS